MEDWNTSWSPTKSVLNMFGRFTEHIYYLKKIFQEVNGYPNLVFRVSEYAILMDRPVIDVI